MKRFLLCLGVLIVLGGCGGVKIVPRPTAGVEYDEGAGTLWQNEKGLQVATKVQDLQVRPYQMVDNLCSFFVAIDNHSQQNTAIARDGFILVDSAGNQYRSISPRKVIEMISRESFYLIPYPYVGFYYLEDAVRVSQFAQFDSSLPYFPQRYPQDIYTDALQEGDILPGARVSGLVYFIADLSSMQAFDLRLYLPGTSLSQDPDFLFPFSIEKN